jgi:hypothetical protein
MGGLRRYLKLLAESGNVLNAGDDLIVRRVLAARQEQGLYQRSLANLALLSSLGRPG